MRGHIILANFPGGIDSIENLKSVFTIKNRTFDKTTAKGANPESLALRVEALKLEKWEPQKPNKKSVPMTREKPEDIQLEDDVWCMLYKLGFDQMNIDRQLKVSICLTSAPMAPVSRI